MWSLIKPQESNLRWWQVGLLVAVLAALFSRSLLQPSQQEFSHG